MNSPYPLPCTERETEKENEQRLDEILVRLEVAREMDAADEMGVRCGHA